MSIGCFIYTNQTRKTNCNLLMMKMERGELLGSGEQTDVDKHLLVWQLQASVIVVWYFIVLFVRKNWFGGFLFVHLIHIYSTIITYYFFLAHTLFALDIIEIKI